MANGGRNPQMHYIILEVLQHRDASIEGGRGQNQCAVADLLQDVNLTGFWLKDD